MIDRKRIEWIEKITMLMNDSWSETVEALLDAHHNCRHCDARLVSMIEQELLGEIEWAEENLKIVKATELREITYEVVETIND